MEKYAKQGELMLKRTGTGNQSAKPVGKARVVNL
jgi:hypothetical protein